MRYRSDSVVVVWLAALCVVVVGVSIGESQTTTQKPGSSSQQQLKAQPAQTTVKQVKPVGPVSPVQSDLKIDARASDIAAAGAIEVMVVDLQGDGLDLGGRAKIQIGGAEIDTNWTRPNTGDAFLVLDAAVLGAMGFEMRGGDGQVIGNRILVSDGVSLKGPNGNEVTSIDSWSLMVQFDVNNDGRIDSSDETWQSLSLFTDANADGTMGDGEVASIVHSAVRELSLARSASRTDADGNTLTEGTFTTSNGTSAILAGVRLRRY